MKLDSLCQQIIVALLMVIIIGVPLYFDTRLYSAFDLSKITLLYMLVFALVVTWCVKRINNSEGAYTYNILLIPIACYMAVGIASTLFAIDPVTSLLGTYKRYNGLLSLFTYCFLFFIIINYVEKSMIDLFINLIIISACITCVYGFVQYLGFDIYTWNTNYGHGTRIFSTIGHPAFLSAYLVMVLPFVYYRLIQSCNVYSYGLMICCIIMILVAFYMTKTRATFLALVLSNIFFFAFMGRDLIRKNKFKVVTIAVLVVGLSIGFNVIGENTVAKRIVSDIEMSKEGGVKLQGSAHERYDNVLMAIEIIKDCPFLGIGFDNLGIAFVHYIQEVYKKTGRTKEDFLRIRTNQDRIHSNFWDVAVNTGLIGLAVYLWCIYSYVRMMWTARNEHRLLILALGTGVFAYFIQNQFSFGHIPIIVLFWVLMGLSCIVCRTKQQTQYSTA